MKATMKIVMIFCLFLLSIADGYTDPSSTSPTTTTLFPGFKATNFPVSKSPDVLPRFRFSLVYMAPVLDADGTPVLGPDHQIQYRSYLPENENVLSANASSEQVFMRANQKLEMDEKRIKVLEAKVAELNEKLEQISQQVTQKQ